MVVTGALVDTAFPRVNVGAAVAVGEVDQESGALVAVADEAPDVAGFQLLWDEGGGRLFCWGNSTAVKTDGNFNRVSSPLKSDNGGVTANNRRANLPPLKSDDGYAPLFDLFGRPGGNAAAPKSCGRARPSSRGASAAEELAW